MAQYLSDAAGFLIDLNNKKSTGPELRSGLIQLQPIERLVYCLAVTEAAFRCGHEYTAADQSYDRILRAMLHSQKDVRVSVNAFAARILDTPTPAQGWVLADNRVKRISELCRQLDADGEESEEGLAKAMEDCHLQERQAQ